MSLGPRLRLVAGLVPSSGAVADVGSGHGGIAAGLAAEGRRVVATELRPTTLAALRADLERSGASVETRLGRGFAPLAPGEVDIAVIAGMGGRSIIGILEAAPWLPATLVLQPVQDVAMVREWVARRGWAFEERTARQRGRDYSAFRVTPAPA